MESYDLIVIGGVAAGTKAAAKSRRENRDGRILVITEEGDVSYAGCGLPYYLGGTIPNRQGLLVKTPEALAESRQLEIKTKHRAAAIDPGSHSVSVTDLKTGNDFRLQYKKLFLATGAEPIVPPLPGLELPGVHTLRSITDADAIMSKLGEKGHATIVGGGFIGVEMAENLAEAGWGVSIIEMLPHILPPFDKEIAMAIEKNMRSRGINIHTGSKLESVSAGNRMEVKTSTGAFETDLVVLSIGVSPRSAMAKEAGLELGIRGSIKVDKFGRTSDPDIYASGDCASTFGILSESEVWAPMGSTSNKQARATALTLSGDDTEFPGVLGTMAVKAFDMAAARTGLGESEAREKYQDIETVFVPADDIAHYYPGSNKIFMKLIAARDGKILGAQAYGHGNVDKPIDVFMTAITLGATVHDLAYADFVYAPPFSTAINPVNLACLVMQNKLSGKLESLGPTESHELINSAEWDGLLLDIRTEPEHMVGTLPGAINIPLAQLESRQSELEEFKEKDIIIICNVGKDAYEAYLRLKHWGFIRAKLLEGGTKCWPYKLE